MKKKSVEIIDHGDGTYSVRVYDTIVFIGTHAECEARAGQE